MTDHNRQFDDMERHLSDRLRRDLQNLFEPPGGVPPQVDKTILDQARRRLAQPRRRILRLRWAAGIAAAAAIAIGALLYYGPASSNQQSTIIHHQSAAAEGRADIDGNGRVDILDAFRLARHIEAHGPANPRWDLNGDGRVDQADVDLAAAAAVRLGPPKGGTAALSGDGNPAGGRRATTVLLGKGV